MSTLYVKEPLATPVDIWVTLERVGFTTNNATLYGLLN